MTKATHTATSPRLFAWLAPLVLIAAITFAYHDTLSVPFLFDDTASIQQNLTLDSLWQSLRPPADSGVTVSGRPLLNLSFALSDRLGAGTLAGHHLVNIAIHAANACLLYALVLGTLQLSSVSRYAPRFPHAHSLAIALLWSLHPLQTESVTYLVQRAESLAAFFYLLTLYLFLRSQTTPPHRSRFLLIATVTACALGMAAKEVMVSAPLLVLLYDRAFLSRDLPSAWKTKKHFYLALFSTWAVLILCIIQSGSRGNTAGFHAGTSWIDYIYTQAFAITHYLRLAFWPSPIVFDYGRELITSFNSIAWPAALLIVAIAWIFKRWWHNRPSGFLGVLFLAVLAPTTLVPVATQTIAEHRTYLALAPLFAGTVLLFARLLGEKAACFLTAALSLTLVFITLDRNRDYHSVESIWSDTLAKRPTNDRAWHSMGYVYLEKNLPDEAKNSFRQAMQLHSDPVNIMGYAHALTKSGDTGEADEAIYLYRTALAAVPSTYTDVYESMSNLGLLLGQKGEYDEALRWLNNAIALAPRKTGAPYNLGSLYFSLGRYEEATAPLRLALSDPKQGDAASDLLVRALLSLGKTSDALALAEKQTAAHPDSLLLRLSHAQALAASGRLDAALAEYQAILAQAPAFPSARTQLGILFFATRRLPDARRELALAVTQNPRDAAAQSTLAEVLLKSGEPDEAVPHFEAALQLAPADRKSRYLLANTLLQLGDLDDAIPHYQRLIQEKSPPLAEIHNQLAIAYAQKNDFAQARAHFSECLRLDPKHTGASENLRRLPAP
ncbi:hypothetical protein CMV30_04990 [Nibricoccus aquaticus]|uniref:Uncharacterized protein n=1 Tax=Nibricoccus aquaticus TaxID=2576891 RepID=A0A290Q3W6_9BACT|nr:tetratricopeptide repeat protein [Nibricoccus aquaticus]ATC63359.1 hypothetical protein CMV30_04990 [Nibricoccus aquaticus]